MKSVFTKKLAMAGLLSAFALISFMIENLFPPFFIPGARIGVSNVFILLAFFLLGDVYAFAVLMVKVLLGSLFAGNFSAVIYSLPAGLISLIAEIILFRKAESLSVLCVSVFGGVINLTVQNTVFCFVTNSYDYFFYLPYLSLIGFIGGFTVGLAVTLILRTLPKRFNYKNVSFSD